MRLPQNQHFILIVSMADKAAGDALMQEVFGGSGGAFNTPLTTNGVPPATHYGAYVTATDTEGAQLKGNVRNRVRSLDLWYLDAVTGVVQGTNRGGNNPVPVGTATDFPSALALLGYKITWPKSGIGGG